MKGECRGVILATCFTNKNLLWIILPLHSLLHWGFYINPSIPVADGHCGRGWGGEPSRPRPTHNRPSARPDQLRPIHSPAFCHPQRICCQQRWNKCSDRGMEVWLPALLESYDRQTDKPTDSTNGQTGSCGSYTSNNAIKLSCISLKATNAFIHFISKLAENKLERRI